MKDMQNNATGQSKINEDKSTTTWTVYQEISVLLSIILPKEVKILLELI